MLLIGDPGYLKAETCVPIDSLLLTVGALREESCLFYFVLYPIPDLGVWHMLGSQNIDIETRREGNNEGRRKEGKRRKKEERDGGRWKGFSAGRGAESPEWVGMCPAYWQEDDLSPFQISAMQHRGFFSPL